MRTILLLLLFGALCSCAAGPAPSPQSVDARALCQQLAQASASSPEQRSDAYFDQCMIAEQPTPQITMGRRLMAGNADTHTAAAVENAQMH